MGRESIRADISCEVGGGAGRTGFRSESDRYLELHHLGCVAENFVAFDPFCQRDATTRHVVDPICELSLDADLVTAANDF